MNKLKNFVSGDGNKFDKFLKNNDMQGAMSLVYSLVSVLNHMDQPSQNTDGTRGSGSNNEAAQQVYFYIPFGVGGWHMRAAILCDLDHYETIVNRREGLKTH